MALKAALFRIEELGAKVALALSVDYDGPPNSRVREVPDRRTIRYYTTLGLIDRPAEMRGRTALYGQRHLLQLVAIKRLQGRGLSLAEIQQHLVGQTDAALRRLARLPDLEGLSAPSTPAEVPDNAGTERSTPFWTASPAPAPGPAQGDEQADATPDAIRSTLPPPSDHASEEAAAVVPLQGLPLNDEVLLLFAPSRSVDEEDIAALRVAAAPLLKLLERRRLLRPREERGTP